MRASDLIEQRFLIVHVQVHVEVQVQVIGKDHNFVLRLRSVGYNSHRF